MVVHTSQCCSCVFFSLAVLQSCRADAGNQEADSSLLPYTEGGSQISRCTCFIVDIFIIMALGSVMGYCGHKINIPFAENLALSDVSSL